MIPNEKSFGIFLFLKYIKESKSIKIESKLQDIEIELRDGNKILAQAKSAQDYSIAKDKKEKFKDAIISLAKYQKETNQMIYISNIPDMLESAGGAFNNNIVSYDSCLGATKKEIDDIFETMVINKSSSKKTDFKNKLIGEMLCFMKN